MVRCYHEDDRAISGDVESTSRTYLPEEDACDHAPEDEGGLVGQVRRKRERFYMVRHVGVGRRTSQAMIKVKDRSVSSRSVWTRPRRAVGDAHVTKPL